MTCSKSLPWRRDPNETASGKPVAVHLTAENGVLLIRILRRKAEDLNRILRLGDWTPRKIDKVLWTYGR